MFGVRDLLLTIIRLAWIALLALVGGRFLILLFDIDRDGEFVQHVLSWSDFWVKPFANLIHMSDKAVSATGGVFEPASALAFVVYFVAGMLILGALRSATSFGGYLRHA
ncbi:MAG TPA: hypothetical protein VH951_06620 [Dehalococcoidia bacterium]